MLVLAHLSDTHIDGGTRTQERTTRALDHIARLATPPDLVLITGDITHRGTPEEYAHARQLLLGPSPILTLPGNHDDRANYRRHLHGLTASDTPVNAVHRHGGVVFVLLDSVIPGSNAGELSAATHTWLDHTLADNADEPVFLCLHHHPVPLHMPFVDQWPLHGAEKLAALLERHPNVVAVVCGHAHTPAVTTFANRPLLVAPGLASTVRLAWEEGHPQDYDHPALIAFHTYEHGRITTHFRAV
ncbi:metallophosphoesterase [Lipingzhangella sp. LS1_29]|uniref:Metallophosphoesterase n=1 Tax=Lipingzhangella rawalii TaxID=2055835 RepID=A0ABU2H1B7_9ACTN|nr:metallophosphoesterase [Lipingzhangella rawalii]MDS1269112.1 metallophosphoesterase [Lipingzhangella rawalii]